MDWLKLFALLVAVASVQITADGPKKKIRIHLPQAVKHIHHHKKIYITNHPAPSQYAPAYLPGVKGGVALPSNVARPAVASIVPYNSVELYDEARSRLPGVSPSASKLLPLYRARGRYGPDHSEWDEQEYDLLPPPESSDFYESSGYKTGPTAPAPAPAPPKKVKIIKINDSPRKKVIRKIKPKRIIVRGKPQPPVVPVQPPPDEELPVTSFHEQFYADLEEAGTIRKIKKPPRIEKIIDGDTEHIHTYTEEHIHKVVFDDDSKVTGVVGVDPIGSMSALSAAHPLVPLKNAQSLYRLPNLAVMGSMGTPSQLEYAAYNPRDVTHDHIFHDHGEIPPGVDINKEGLRIPPKVSYNSHGLRIQGDSSKRYYNKRYRSKPTKPTQDYSYYESMYSPQAYRPRKLPKPTVSTSHFHDHSHEPVINDFRPIPSFRFKDNKRKVKSYHSSEHSLPLPQASVPAPFSVSTTVVHDYPKSNAGSNTGSGGYSKYRDHLVDFKDTSYSNDFDYDNYASSSNTFTSEDNADSSQGKKSVSSQNVSFGGQDRQTYVDHLAASGSNIVPMSVEPTSSLDEINEFIETTASDGASPTPYTIKETSPAHEYFSSMALKALREAQDASNDNMEYSEPPSPSSEATETPLATTTSQTIHFYKIQSTDAIPEPEYVSDTRLTKKRREKHKNDSRQRYNAVFKELVAGYKESEEQSRAHAQAHSSRHPDNKYFHSTDSSSVRGNPKYGDKI